jgi:hypothetical protein
MKSLFMMREKEYPVMDPNTDTNWEEKVKIPL